MANSDDEILNHYTRVLRSRWPQVVTQLDHSLPVDEGGPVLDVFGLPDGVGEEFVRFMLEVYADVESSRLCDVSVIPHYRSATKRHYPDQHEQVLIREFFLDHAHGDPIVVHDTEWFWSCNAWSPRSTDDDLSDEDMQGFSLAA